MRLSHLQEKGFKIRDKSRGYGVADKTYKTRDEAKKAAAMHAARTGGDWEVIEEGRMSDQMIGDSETMSKEEFAKKYGKKAAEEFFEGFASDAQRKAAFANGYDPKKKKKKTESAQKMSKKDAMDKALRSIEQTFSPEREKIKNQVLAMARTVSMLKDDRWKDRAFSNVEEYGIKNAAELKQEMELMLADEKKKMTADVEGLDVGTSMNIRQLERSLQDLSGLSESMGWCAICLQSPCACTDDRVMEQEVGGSITDVENILISMQHDINKGKLIPEHRDQLIQQHNKLMEVYEKMLSGDLTEDNISEALPLAALAVHGARMAAGAALRTTAGQAVKRGAIAGAKRAASRLFKRGSRTKRRDVDTDVAGGVGNKGPKQFGKLGLTKSGNDDDAINRAYAAGVDPKALGAMKK